MKPEQFQVWENSDGKVRNRAEAHLVEFTRQLVASPLAMTIEQVRAEVLQEQERTTRIHPSWGKCIVRQIAVAGRMMHNHNHVERAFSIFGRGRLTYTLSVRETVMKDAANGYAPLLK